VVAILSYLAIVSVRVVGNENKKYHNDGTFAKLNRKNRRKRDKIDNPIAYILTSHFTGLT